MNKITVTTNVENGILKRNRKMILDIIASFEGKIIDITFQKKRKSRSNQQNAYYWGVLLPILQGAIKDSWGEIWSIDKVHELVKNRFCYTEKINEDSGEILQLPKSTTECTTTEFEEYQSQVREFLSEWFNVDAPLPNEQISLI
jgi:hypothetical protein